MLSTIIFLALAAVVVMAICGLIALREGHEVLAKVFFSLAAVAAIL